ncbi:MAG: hypothetical protein Q8N47_08660 [Bryobacterales bacterium]|nr:hypothetical protein [Bryobacterales bacterium]
MTPGDKFGPYTLISPIGEGGMGEVWKARDTRLDRTVALKVSKEQFTSRGPFSGRGVTSQVAGGGTAIAPLASD